MQIVFESEILFLSRYVYSILDISGVQKKNKPTCISKTDLICQYCPNGMKTGNEQQNRMLNTTL